MDSLFLKLRSLTIYLVVFAFPWFFLPITPEFFLTQKFYLVLGGVLVATVLAALSLLTTKKIHLMRSAFDRIFLLLGVSQILALLFASPNKIQALTALPWGLVPVLSLIALYFFIVQTVHTKEKLHTLIYVFIVGASIASLVSIIFWFDPLAGNQLSQQFEFLKTGRFSVIGNVFDSMFLAGFLAILSLMQVVKKLGKNTRPEIISTLGFIIGLVAVILLGYRLVVPPQDSVRIQLPSLETSWLTTVESLKTVETALVGVGTDNYETAFTIAKPRSYNVGPLWETNYSLSRSMLLHIWTETGILGLIAMLLLWVYIIREVHGLFLEKDADRNTFAALAIYLGIIMICMPPSYIIFFLTIILCSALAIKSYIYNKEDALVDMQKFPLLYVCLALVMIAAVCGLTYGAGRAYAGEYNFKQSLDGIRKNNGRLAYNSLVSAIQMNPYIERYHMQFAQINLVLANNTAQKKDLKDEQRQNIARLIQLAIAEGKTTIQLNPNKVSYWNNLAVIYRNIINVAEGSEAWTVASYRRAILLDPNNPSLRLNLGGVYYALKDYPEASKLFEQAAALKPNWPNAFYNLAWAEFQEKQYDNAVTHMETVLKLVEKDTADYKKAQENLKAFQEEGKKQQPAKEATGSGNLEQGQNLNLPPDPKPKLSPALELPEGSGPEKEIGAPVKEPVKEVTPTPAQK